MNKIGAIILAAGESKRMGSPKMILPFGNSTVIGTVIQTLLASEVNRVMVVLGADSERVLDAFRGTPVDHCYNADYREGMLSSVKCGLRNLPADLRAVLVFPGDQPMIGTDIVNLIIKSYLETGKGLVVPVYGKERGHPLLIDNKYRDEVLGSIWPDGLRGLIRRHQDDLLEVETDDPSVLRDIDTREDYVNELN